MLQVVTSHVAYEIGGKFEGKMLRGMESGKWKMELAKVDFYFGTCLLPLSKNPKSKSEADSDSDSVAEVESEKLRIGI